MESQQSLVDNSGDQMQIHYEDEATAFPSPGSEGGHKLADRRLNLVFLQIPPGVKEAAVEPTSSNASSSLLPPLSATKCGKVSVPRPLLPPPGFRARASLDKTVQQNFTAPTGTQSRAPDSSLPLTSNGSAPKSLAIPMSAKRTSSLPVRMHVEISAPGGPGSGQGQGKAVDIDVLYTERGLEKVGIVRSFSSPVHINKLASLPRGGPGSRGFVLLRSASPRALEPRTPQGIANANGAAITPAGATRSDFEIGDGNGVTEQEADEEIPEDEAVCRICMDGLTEEYGETLKMECSCRGEMALAHKDCAFKWFRIKGNRTCDVCGREVSNIPVTVVRLPEVINVTTTRSTAPPTTPRAGGRQDVPVLVIISMLAYFCFLEQLLARKMGSGALAIALPFSIIIGLLASITTITLVSRRYTSLYACIQFGLVVLFAYVFYEMLQLEALLAVVLAAFAGFGVAMTTNALTVEYVHWKRSPAAQQRDPHSTAMEERPLQDSDARTDAESPPAATGGTSAGPAFGTPLLAADARSNTDAP